MKRALCAGLILFLLAMSACGDAKPASASFQAMDTLMNLTVYGDDDLCDTLKDRIAALDRALDATDENSEIFRLNTEKTAALSESTSALLRGSLALCRSTEGSFDITVYPAVQAWGFTSGDYRVPDAAERKTLAQKIDYTAVGLGDDGSATLPDGVMLDLGAVAKGYAADICGDVLREGKAQAAVLNLGGTIKLYGKKPDGSRFKVGIADPANPAGYFGYLTCDEGVVATSGGYERYFERDGKRYIHILDPASAAPADSGVQSVTIISSDGTAADALSTALFVMGLDKATEYYRNHPDFDFIILTDDGDLYLTEGVYSDFTLAEGYDLPLHQVES